MAIYRQLRDNQAHRRINIVSIIDGTDKSLLSQTSFLSAIMNDPATEAGKTAAHFSHRQDAVMSLGIERGVLGGIIAGESPVVLICLPEISGYIIIRPKIPADEIPAKEEPIRIKTDTVVLQSLT